MALVNCGVSSALSTKLFCDGNSPFFAPTAGAGASKVGGQHEPVFAVQPDAVFLAVSTGPRLEWQQQLRGTPSLFGLQHGQPQQMPLALPCAIAQQAAELQPSSL